MVDASGDRCRTEYAQSFPAWRGWRIPGHASAIQTDRRDALKQYLAENQIDSKVHYPIPIHLQKAASGLGFKKGDFPVAESQSEKILSLPIYPELTQKQIEYVVETIKTFFQKNPN